MNRFLLYILIGILGQSCVKEITVDLPTVPNEIVVEGRIEQGQPPFVVLSKSFGYFDPVNTNTLAESFIKNAKVTVSDGTNSVALDEVCTGSLPIASLNDIANQLGISVTDLAAYNICFYTTLNSAIYGKIGNTYDLKVEVEGKTITSTTTIPQPVRPNNYYFKIQPSLSYSGFLWFELSDPANTPNSYRFFTMRKNKDTSFQPGFGSVFDDQFFDGKTFDGYMAKGYNYEQEISPSNNKYFKTGDTVFVKMCSIDKAHFRFWRTYENEVFSGGNPFVSATTIQSNIEGGLGIWGGYAVSIDTVAVYP